MKISKAFFLFNWSVLEKYLEVTVVRCKNIKMSLADKSFKNCLKLASKYFGYFQNLSYTVVPQQHNKLKYSLEKSDQEEKTKKKSSFRNKYRYKKETVVQFRCNGRNGRFKLHKHKCTNRQLKHKYTST
jgi:hypothetical protein